MGSLQESLQPLQPYVIGIRYVSEKPVVDAVFKDGWILPDSKMITKIKGDNSGANYYMLYSELDGIGLDELLDYVRVVIGVNVEREKKHALLKDKIEELKSLFKKNTLAQLTKLKFIITDDVIIPEPDEIGLHEIDPVEIEESLPQRPVNHQEPVQSVVKDDLDGQMVTQLTEEDEEILEEERRAENFRLYQEQQGKKTAIKKHQKVELPPKPKQREMAYATGCDCGENEACEKCIDSKGY